MGKTVMGNALGHQAGEGADGYDMVEEYEDYTEYEEDQDDPQEETSPGLFSTPGRAVALIGSLVLLLGIMAMVVWMLGTKGPATGSAANVAGNVKVPVITQPNLGGEGEAPSRGSLAPNFEWLDPNTGKPVRLSSLRGKPVFINFWGTWCPPCRAEMPEMQRLYNQYKGQMEFVGISMGPRDNSALVANFVNTAGYNWLFVQDDTYAVATRYQVQAVPSSYFIDANGVIKAVHIGGMNGSMMEAYLQQVR